MKILSIILAIFMMTAMSNAAEITCSLDSYSGSCMIQSITEVSQHNEPITVVGQPANYINTATTTASFTPQNFIIRYIPTKLFSVFPNIQSFALYNSSLTYIVTDAFTNCESLNMVYLANTEVKHLSAGFAQTCTNLTSFALMDSLLETLDADAFRGLSKLNMLYLRNNKISCLPGTIFQPTPNLGSITLEMNMITGLHPMTLKGLKALNYFNIYSNQLQSLAPMDLSDAGIYNGLTIGVQKNPINAISPDFMTFFSTRPTNITDNIFMSEISCVQDPSLGSVSTNDYKSALPKLQTCFNNWQPSMATTPTCPVTQTTLAPITTVPPTTLAPSTSGTCPSDKICRYFLDQYHRYTCILDGVDSLLTSIGGTHLITFDDLAVRRVVFTNSFLLRIPPILFQKFPNLEYLTASNCSMSSINTKTFGTTCGNLKFFDASYNDITSVEGASFKSCTKIEVVDLTGNQFGYIDGQLFVNNPTLKSIYINRPPSMVLL